MSIGKMGNTHTHTIHTHTHMYTYQFNLGKMPTLLDPDTDLCII